MFVREGNLCVCNQQKARGMPCDKLINCPDCPSYGGDIFYYLRFLEGYSYQQYRFKQNCILFLLQGEIQIDGLHFPHLIIRNKQSLVIPVGIELDIHILKDSDCLVYRFNELPVLCEEQYKKILLAQQEGTYGNLLDTLPPIHEFTQGIIHYLGDGIPCNKLLELKQQEMFFLLYRYYSSPQMTAFLYPILRNQNHFRRFVLQNYYKVKTVEELALLGRYGLITFRRLFKAEFGEAAYRWIIRQRQAYIHYDLTHRNLSISEIADKYHFESLSQFSNFCKKYFGCSPREIQTQKSLKQK